MDLIKRDIVEEINENINNKFKIMDDRLDKLFQKIPDKVNDSNQRAPEISNLKEKENTKEVNSEKLIKRANKTKVA